MNKGKSKKYGWILILALIVLINMVAQFWHFRIDLTEEKRFTLSEPTKKMIRNLNEPVSIEVFLDGDMPAGFRKLAGSTKDLLQDFKEIGNSKIRFRFRKPLEGLDDSARAYLMDSLQRLGLNPMNVKAQIKEGESKEERLLFP